MSIFDRISDVVNNINSLGSSGVSADGRTVLRGRVGNSVQTVIFPFTPMVNLGHQVNYNTYNLTHTNYSVQSYMGTPSPVIQVTGQFTTHTQEEHKYVRDVITFFRTVTKMHYGKKDPKAGTPPPVCRFTSHGRNMFENVPVVVASFNIPLDGQTDQIVHDGTALPAIIQLSCDLMVHVNPAKQKEEFSLQSFASGELYNRGFI